jgi:hypothetical protein
MQTKAAGSSSGGDVGQVLMVIVEISHKTDTARKRITPVKVKSGGEAGIGAPATAVGVQIRVASEELSLTLLRNHKATA